MSALPAIPEGLELVFVVATHTWYFRPEVSFTRSYQREEITIALQPQSDEGGIEGEFCIGWNELNSYEIWSPQIRCYGGGRGAGINVLRILGDAFLAQLDNPETNSPGMISNWLTAVRGARNITERQRPDDQKSLPSDLEMIVRRLHDIQSKFLFGDEQAARLLKELELDYRKDQIDIARRILLEGSERDQESR